MWELSKDMRGKYTMRNFGRAVNKLDKKAARALKRKQMLIAGCKSLGKFTLDQMAVKNDICKRLRRVLTSYQNTKIVDREQSKILNAKCRILDDYLGVVSMWTPKILEITHGITTKDRAFRISQLINENARGLTEVEFGRDIYWQVFNVLKEKTPNEQIPMGALIQGFNAYMMALLRSVKNVLVQFGGKTQLDLIREGVEPNPGPSFVLLDESWVLTLVACIVFLGWAHFLYMIVFRLCNYMLKSKDKYTNMTIPTSDLILGVQKTKKYDGTCWFNRHRTVDVISTIVFRDEYGEEYEIDEQVLKVKSELGGEEITTKIFIGTRYQDKNDPRFEHGLDLGKVSIGEYGICKCGLITTRETTEEYLVSMRCLRSSLSLCLPGQSANILAARLSNYMLNWNRLPWRNMATLHSTKKVVLKIALAIQDDLNRVHPQLQG